MIACLHRVSEDGINAHSFHAKWFDKVPENCEKITVPPPPHNRRTVHAGRDAFAADCICFHIADWRNN